MDVMLSGLGDEWKLVCPKSPIWESDGEAWSEDESVSSSDSREDNVVIGLYGPGDNVSLSLLEGLGGCKGGLELSHGPGHAVPGHASCLVAGLMLPRGLLSLHGIAFAHRGRAVTAEKRDVVRGNRSEKEAWQVFVV